MLAACYMIEDGYEVHMIGFDNGHMWESDYIQETAGRVVSTSGKDKAVFDGIFPTAGKMYQKMRAVYKDAGKFDFEQMTCLCCQLSMFEEAIDYCRRNGIDTLASGHRHSDPYVISNEFIIGRIRKLCEENGITLVEPVYGIDDKTKIKIELANRSIHPKTMEPQCWLGVEPEDDNMPYASYEVVKKYIDYINFLFDSLNFIFENGE